MNLPATPATGTPPPQPPRINKRAILVGAVFGLVCFGAGVSLYGEPKTIVKHEVGPTHTVYVPAKSAPPVKTIEVKMPQSCQDAIALAAGLSQNAVTMADSGEPMIDAMKAVGVALHSGDKNKMNQATEKISKLNSATLKAKTDYAIIYPQFLDKWKLCEKESK